MLNKFMRWIPWASFALAALAGIGMTLGILGPAVNLIAQRRVFGWSDAPLTACDVPNFCGEPRWIENPPALDAVSRSTQLWNAAPGFVMTIVILAALALGAIVVRNISRGEPFTPSTVRSLGLASAILVGGGGIGYLVEEAAFSRSLDEASARLAAEMADTGTIIVGTTPMVPSLAVLLGILGLAVWAAFRRGAEMREELDSVI